MRGTATSDAMARIVGRRIGAGTTTARMFLVLGIALLPLAGGLAMATEPLPSRIALWLSPPPADGRLEACWQDKAATAWQLAQQDLLRVRIGQDLQLQRLDEAGSRSRAWTQRCFQLRDGTRILLQGALVPAESARLLPATLPVLVLENRARHVPVLRLGCGFPARSATSLRACASALGDAGGHGPLPDR